MEQKPGGLIIVTCEYRPFPGGIATYAAGFAAAARAAGIATVVVAPVYADAADAEGDDIHRILRHHRISPGAALQMLRILRRYPADWLVLGADIRSIFVLYLLRRFHGRRYITMVHGSEAAKLRAGGPVAGVLRWAYLAADRVCYNSEATGRIFRAAAGQPRSEVVSYLGVDASWYQPQPGPFENPALANLSPDRVVVCSVGRIEPRKGQLDAVKAMASVRVALASLDPVYVIAGHAEDEDYLRAVVGEAAQSGVSILVAGAVSNADLRRLFSRSACHILLARELPGKVEGFGLVLAEAAAQGCPSVATDTGGIPEVLGDAGSIVPSGDIDAAATAVVSYCRDAEFRRRKSRASMERAAHFTWADCVQKTLKGAV